MSIKMLLIRKGGLHPPHTPPSPPPPPSPPIVSYIYIWTFFYETWFNSCLEGCKEWGAFWIWVFKVKGGVSYDLYHSLKILVTKYQIKKKFVAKMVELVFAHWRLMRAYVEIPCIFVLCMLLHSSSNMILLLSYSGDTWLVFSSFLFRVFCYIHPATWYYFWAILVTLD